MRDLEKIIPVIDDKIAKLILSMWSSTQDVGELSRMLSIGRDRIGTKIALLKTLGHLNDDGTISEASRSLILADATKAIRK